MERKAMQAETKKKNRKLRKEAKQKSMAEQ
jgi:hypothetical protein